MPEVLIKSVSHEADHVRSYTLVPSSRDQQLATFEAGAHIDLHLPSGLVRQYSLFNDPDQSNVYRVAVLKDPASRGGSAEVHEMLEPGMRLQVSEPRNLFPLQPASGNTLLLAGGIGITPLLAMAHELHRRNSGFALHYCGRHESGLAFVDDLNSAAFADSVHIHLSQQGGRMDAAQVLANPAAADQLYVCGSPSFIDQMLATAKAAGWQESQLKREYFQIDPTPDDTDNREFELVVGRQIYQIPADKSVAEVLSEHGLPVSVSCGQGICGSCLTRVTEGAPDHRDLYLTEEEQASNDQFTPCCSRSKTARLVIEL